MNSSLKTALVQAQKRFREVQFYVLIWGPGSASDTPQREKRDRIRKDLEQLLGPENVWYSEDISEDNDPELDRLRELGDLGSEYVQVQAADAVVLIPESPGSIAEAALYQDELRGKTIVFTTKRQGTSFASNTYFMHKVETVTEREWSSCQRVRRLTKRFINDLRFLKAKRLSQMN